MTERERMIAILRELNLPPTCYVVNGSGSMVMQGVEREKPMGDLDIFCATRVWFNLLSKQHEYGGGEAAVAPTWQLFLTDPTDPKRRCDPPYLFANMYGLEVDVFFEWRTRSTGNFNVAFYIHNAVMVEGIPCAPLQFIVDWKRQEGRAKDTIDVAAILRHGGAE